MEHKHTFEWTDGSSSAADNMIRLFKARGIAWGRDAGGALCMVKGGAMVPVTYYRIEGSLFGIAPRPMRTTDYFRMTAQELSADAGDGYTKEDCMILDSTANNYPFCETLLDALEKADHLKHTVGYESVTILERVNNHYAVLAYGLEWN